MTDLTPAPNGYPLKIVRNQTPGIINRSGNPGELFYGETPSEDRILWLRRKLGEEVTEYLMDGGIDELADVYAVVIALGIEHNTSLRERYITDKRGGFTDCIMMYGRHPEFDAGPVPR